MRTAIALSVLLITAACTSGNQLSQNVAKIPQPEITIIGRTDLTNVPTLASGITAHFEFRIVNQAEIPITLKRIDMGWRPLSAFVGEAALAGAVVDVVLGIDLAHRMLARAFFLRLRRDAGNPRDDEEGVGDFRREEVGREEFVNAVAVLIAQADRPAGVGFRKNPLERHAAVENVLHG